MVAHKVWHTSCRLSWLFPGYRQIFYQCFILNTSDQVQCNFNLNSVRPQLTNSQQASHFPDRFSASLESKWVGETDYTFPCRSAVPTFRQDVTLPWNRWNNIIVYFFYSFCTFDILFYNSMPIHPLMVWHASWNPPFRCSHNNKASIYNNIVYIIII